MNVATKEKMAKKLSIKSIATLAGRSPRAIYEWVRQGLPTKQVNKAKMVYFADLVKWLADERESKKSNASPESMSESERDLRTQKLEEEVRKLKIANEEKEKKLVSVEQLTAEWGVIASTLSRRLEAVGKSLAGDDGIKAIGMALVEAEKEIKRTLESA